ncbi:EF-hand domain-containing protein 1 [Lobulomyces angularis]|nr:EF-hand domain-containing protein 1 [Lobulomyces angularis]
MDRLSIEEATGINIPFLPGNTFKEQSSDYRKPHSLGYKNGYPIQKLQLLGIGLEPIDINTQLLNTSADQLLQSLGSDPKLTYGDKRFHAKPITPRFVPAFVALDKVVLRFDAYFKETVHESTEQYHLRKVRILYFLEDDSISVIEPPVENSGIPQRTFIKRQRLPKEVSGDNLPQSYYSIRDFNIGINVTFYTRTFRIIGCDKFTENYMTQTEGIVLNEKEKMPNDPYIDIRNRPRRDYSVPSVSPVVHHNDKLKKFLDFDRQVLRFYCVWDDRNSMFGELREFVLHYYLVDDCVEVREIAQPNNGRDPFPILLKRQQLSKNENGNEKYISKDLRIGAVVNVLGRPFLIRDCDDYTRRYYSDNFNLTELEMAPIQFEGEDNVVHGLAQETAPYNGYGTIEDSLGSCKYLVLKPPKKDFIKMLENEHKVLRFVAKMESKHKEDKDRRFVISYRLADDMMTIYEPPQRNAGVLGGKFMERTRVLKPVSHSTLSSVSALGSTQTPLYYNADDLYIGARLDIFRHKFVLLDADEYVFNYMEERPEEFKFSDRNLVVKNLKNLGKVNGKGQEVLKKLENQDKTKSGLLDRSAFVKTVKEVFENQLNEHEIITVSRAYEDKNRRVEYKKLVTSFL